MHDNTLSSSLSNPSNDADEDPLIGQRRDYAANTLYRSTLHANPIDQFAGWLEAARKAKLIDATAMALSTVDSIGHPHSRIVLLKKFDSGGFTFYSNYDSEKGQQLSTNPRASILFYWRELERQVRIEGNVNRSASVDADDYFYSRPEGSRFSAAASHQSRPVANRQVLESNVDALRAQFPDGKVKRPANWGGYLLKPLLFEFWQGRTDRLHDRFRYSPDAAGNWATERLAP